MRLVSPEFADGSAIPMRYTCDSEDVSLPLEIAGVPKEAESLALVMFDPDAPNGEFTHWLVWNIPTQTVSIESGQNPPGATQGSNDFGRLGYGGPCPPPGPAHHYHVQLFALDTALDLGPGANRVELESAMSDHILAQVELTGTYERAK